MVFGTQAEYKKKRKKNEVILHNTFFYLPSSHKDKFKIFLNFKVLVTND